MELKKSDQYCSKCNEQNHECLNCLNDERVVINIKDIKSNYKLKRSELSSIINFSHLGIPLWYVRDVEEIALQKYKSNNLKLFAQILETKGKNILHKARYVRIREELIDIINKLMNYSYLNNLDFCSNIIHNYADKIDDNEINCAHFIYNEIKDLLHSQMMLNYVIEEYIEEIEQYDTEYHENIRCEMYNTDYYNAKIRENYTPMKMFTFLMSLKCSDNYYYNLDGKSRFHKFPDAARKNTNIKIVNEYINENMILCTYPNISHLIEKFISSDNTIENFITKVNLEKRKKNNE